MKPERIEPVWVAKAMELADAYALECALHEGSAADEERAALLAHLLEVARGVGTCATHRLLQRGEVIQRGDEVLGDDTVSWLPLAGWEVGTKWDGGAYMPVRRRTAGVETSEGGGHDGKGND